MRMHQIFHDLNEYGVSQEGHFHPPRPTFPPCAYRANPHAEGHVHHGWAYIIGCCNPALTPPLGPGVSSSSNSISFILTLGPLVCCTSWPSYSHSSSGAGTLPFLAGLRRRPSLLCSACPPALVSPCRESYGGDLESLWQDPGILSPPTGPVPAGR